jgi:cyclic pyranopterin phosphate synthase
MIKDSFGRPLLNLRVSVTQRCNLHCPYCHREGEEKRVGNSVTEMTTEEIVRIVKVAISLGMRRVKITGGEPLLRTDILDIVKGIAGIKGLKDLSMTTNGTLLSEYAEDLHNDGLMRVNVNIPTLNSETYRKLVGGNLQDVLNGIEAAIEVGFDPVKLNMLLLKGINEKDISEMMRFASESGAILQLIELEPVNVSSAYFERYHYALDEEEAKLKEKALKVKTRGDMQNRRIYYLPNVNVEVIHPIENTEFCARCTRLRVTSDGKLKPCLMKKTGLVDALTPIRKGEDNDRITQLFMEVCRRREPFYKASSRSSKR